PIHMHTLSTHYHPVVTYTPASFPTKPTHHADPLSPQPLLAHTQPHPPTIPATCRPIRRFCASAAGCSRHQYLLCRRTSTSSPTSPTSAPPPAPPLLPSRCTTSQTSGSNLTGKAFVFVFVFVF